MFKVLRILNRLNVGGPTYNVANLSRYLSSDFETKVLAGFREPDEASSEYLLHDLNIPYTIVPNMHRAISPAKDYGAYKFILNEMNSFQPDIVHTHAAKAGALGRLAAINAKVKPKAILHTYHGNVFDGYFSPLKTKIILGIERYLATKSHAIISISETQKKDLVEKYRIAPAEKIHVIPLGFDLTKFQSDQAAKRKLFRESYGLTDNTIVITIIGRLAPVKNHALFVEALELVKERINNPIVVFVVGDGELMEPTQQLATKKGFNVIVQNSSTTTLQTGDLPISKDSNSHYPMIFTSWRKDIDVINAGSDIIALTSLNEGPPVSIIEALAARKAVISTDVGGVKDVVKHNKTGILATLDPIEYSNQLSRLIENPDLRNELIEGGLGIAEKYSYVRLVNKMQMLYEKLLQYKSSK